MSDIVVSFDFPPMVGGAHSWLYHVYRRWKSDVSVFTTQLSELPEEASLQRAFDLRGHGALTILREARPIPRLDLTDGACVRAFASHAKGIGRIAKRHRDITNGGAHVRLHALRAFPEGVSAYLFSLTHPRSSRLITYAHGEEVLVARTSRQLTFLARRVYAASDLIIANSQSTSRLVLELCPQARVVCIHPGVDASRFAPDAQRRALYRSRWRWPTDTVVVCTLGRMEPRKNHAAVMRAVAEMRKHALPVAFICGGEGPEGASLARLAVELDIADWVAFPGSVPEEEKPMLYGASDIFAMPSIKVGAMIEGFGIVFLEAAASGLPSVCGNSGGQREAVLDGRTGLAVDGTCVESVISAIARLAREPGTRARMGQAAVAWALENDWDKVLGATEAELDKLD